MIWRRIFGKQSLPQVCQKVQLPKFPLLHNHLRYYGTLLFLQQVNLGMPALFADVQASDYSATTCFVQEMFGFQFMINLFPFLEKAIIPQAAFLSFSPWCPLKGVFRCWAFVLLTCYLHSVRLCHGTKQKEMVFRVVQRICQQQLPIRQKNISKRWVIHVKASASSMPLVSSWQLSLTVKMHGTEPGRETSL